MINNLIIDSIEGGGKIIHADYTPELAEELAANSDDYETRLFVEYRGKSIHGEPWHIYLHAGQVDTCEIDSMITAKKYKLTDSQNEKGLFRIQAL